MNQDGRYLLMELGSTVVPSKVSRWMRHVPLADEEAVWLVTAATSISPAVDYVVVTDRRFYAVQLVGFRGSEAVVVLRNGRARPVYAGAKKEWVMVDGGPRALPLRFDSDADRARFEEVLTWAADRPADLPADTLPDRDHSLEAPTARVREAPVPVVEMFPGTRIGGEPSDRVARQIASACGKGEKPWLILSPHSDRALAAFANRVFLVDLGHGLGSDDSATFAAAAISGVSFDASAGGGLRLAVSGVETRAYRGGGVQRVRAFDRDRS